MSDLALRVAALADKLHKPGYPAENAPLVARLAEEVAALLRDYRQMDEARATAWSYGQRLAAELEAVKAEAARVQLDMRHAVADAERRMRVRMLAIVDEALKAAPSDQGRILAAFIKDAVSKG